MTCASVGVDEGPLSHSEYKDVSNNSLKQRVQSACKNFTRLNINKINPELAESWLLLFQLHFNDLEDKDLNTASDNFESVFIGKKTKVLFLNNLAPQCSENTLLLNRACILMTEDIIKLVERKSMMLWLGLIERHREELPVKILSYVVKAIHKVWTIKPNELHQVIQIRGMSSQEHKLPRLLLLQYEAFQNILIKKPSVLKFKQTSLIVLKVFEKYLYEKELSKCEMSPHLWGQLLQIAEEILDEKLIDICIKETKGISYESCITTNAIVGKVFLTEKMYKHAILNFEKASKSPFFIDDHFFCQAINAYLKEWEKAGKSFSDRLHLCKKKLLLNEAIDDSCIKELKEFLEENKEIIQSYDLLDKLKGPISIDSIGNLKIHLDEEIKRVKDELLLKAEKRLKKVSEKTLDVVEILYAKGKIKEASDVFAHCEVEEEIRYFTIQAKLHIAKGEIGAAKQVLQKSLEKDEEDDEVLSTLALLREKGADIIPRLTRNVNLCFHFAIWLHQSEMFELARDYFERSDPYKTEVNYYLGKITGDDNYFKRASLLAIEDNFEIPQVNKGVWHYHEILSKTENCKYTSKALVSLYPYESDLLKKLGDIYMQEGKLEKAKGCYSQVKQLEKSQEAGLLVQNATLEEMFMDLIGPEDYARTFNMELDKSYLDQEDIEEEI